MVPTIEITLRKRPHLIVPEAELALDLLDLEAITPDATAAGDSVAGEVEQPGPPAAASPAAPAPSPQSVTLATNLPPPEPISPIGRALTNPLTWTATAIAAVAGGVGLTFGILSNDAFVGAAADDVTQRQRSDLNSDGEFNALVANSMFAGAGTAFALATVLFLVDLLASDSPPTTAVVASDAGAGITF